MHTRKCRVCGSTFQTSAPNKQICSDKCKRKSVLDAFNLRKKTPAYKETMRAYRQKHHKNKSTYVGVVVCPKCGLKGYKCILTSTSTPINGKVGVYSYYICQHRHSIGKKQIYDKTCTIGKSNLRVNRVES